MAVYFVILFIGAATTCCKLLLSSEVLTPQVKLYKKLEFFYSDVIAMTLHA